MNKEHTKIVVVLDESGSMSTIRKDTIGGFNTFIQDQRKVPYWMPYPELPEEEGENL